MPKITVLPPGASLSSDDLIIIVNAPGGAAATQYATLAQLRVALYAQTGADPITAGAASFTTLAASSTAAITGNLTVGASTFVVTAATGNTAIAGIISAGGATTAGCSAGEINIPNNTFYRSTNAAGTAGRPLIGLQSGTNIVQVDPVGGGVTMGASLAITGALTGVTTLAASGAITSNGGVQTFGANDSGGAGKRLVLVPNV